MAVEGHEEQCSPPTLSARYVIRQETFAGTHGNGRDAPKTAVRRTSGTDGTHPLAVIRRHYVDRPSDNLWWPLSITL
jgi:hypothetical protein